MSFKDFMTYKRSLIRHIYTSVISWWETNTHTQKHTHKTYTLIIYTSSAHCKIFDCLAIPYSTTHSSWFPIRVLLISFFASWRFMSTKQSQLFFCFGQSLGEGGVACWWHGEITIRRRHSRNAPAYTKYTHTHTHTLTQYRHKQT